MKYIAREQIKKLFDDPQLTMMSGLYFSGYEGEGERKDWWSDGQLYRHFFSKDGQREGEYKQWNENGQLWIHCFYKNGKIDGEFKRWYDNGQLQTHCLYKKGKIVKDYLK